MATTREDADSDRTPVGLDHPTVVPCESGDSDGDDGDGDSDDCP